MNGFNKDFEMLKLFYLKEINNFQNGLVKFVSKYFLLGLIYLKMVS